MLAELTRIEAGWPLAVSLAATVAGQGLLAGRRRALLNEALHELRRPLQALVLSTSAPGAVLGGGADLSTQAALALERLDRRINGGPEPARRERVRVGELAAAAVGRWRERAAQEGTAVELRDGPADRMIHADRATLAQALDNLIVNAIEHGGPTVLVGADQVASSLWLVVTDSGSAEVGLRRRWSLHRLPGAISGRRRRGHGLRVVRRVAAAHGGEFRLRRAGGGTAAILELPLAADEDAG